jgi:hypothetical protein
MEKVVSEIRKDGGNAEAAEVDALDQRAVETHLDNFAGGGRIDFLLNAIGYPPEGYGNARLLLDVSLEQFTLPLRTILPSQFITATSAARHMILGHFSIFGTHKSSYILVYTRCEGSSAKRNRQEGRGKPFSVC